MNRKKPTIVNPFISLTILITFISCMSLGQLVFAVNLNGLLLILLILLSCITCLIGYSFDEILEMMLDSLKSSLGALLIFILIGALVASWIFSGSLPAMIYYGVSVINPRILLPTAFILCMITSLVAGTSWGTVSTVGIIIVEIAATMDVNLAAVAGAVISGACFGDKISPMSDTTNLAAMASDIPVSDHIRSMLKTTIPTTVICLIFYTVYGYSTIQTTPSMNHIAQIQDVLSENFHIDVITFIPIVFTLMITFFYKAHALVSFGVGILSACIIGVYHQENTWSHALTVLSSGFQRETGNIVVDKLINRGGIDSMMNVFAMSVLVICIGGILSSAGYLTVITNPLEKMTENISLLITTTISTTAISCMATGDSYMPIIITGRVYQQIYNKANIPRSILSRCCEDGATLLVPIIPWSVTALFFTQTLGVDTWSYLPFAMLCWLNIIVSIFFSLFINSNKGVINESSNLLC